MARLQSMLLLDEQTVLLGSLNKKIIYFNLEKNNLLGRVHTEGEVCLLKPSECLVCCAETSGLVGLYDPCTMMRIKTLTTYKNRLSDMEVVGPYLVACGLAYQ